MTRARKLIALLGVSAGVYALAVRPHMLRWGASDGEVRGPYPGDDLISRWVTRSDRGRNDRRRTIAAVAVAYPDGLRSGRLAKTDDATALSTGRPQSSC